MKDYSAMSNEDIAKEVGNHLGLEWANLNANYSKLCYWEMGAGPLVFDPCNNPADAWPIIEENKISLDFDGDGYEPQQNAWCKASTQCGHVYYGSEKEPLRNAMIAFLMMKEADKSHG